MLQLQVIRSILAGAKILSLLQSVNIRTGVHPSSHSVELVIKGSALEADHLSYLAVTLIMNGAVPAVLRKPSCCAR